MSHQQFYEQCQREQEWLEEQQRLATTADGGKQCGERFRAGATDEQKQSDRDEQQPMHPLV